MTQQKTDQTAVIEKILDTSKLEGIPDKYLDRFISCLDYLDILDYIDLEYSGDVENVLEFWAL